MNKDRVWVVNPNICWAKPVVDLLKGMGETLVYPTPPFDKFKKIETPIGGLSNLRGNTVYLVHCQNSPEFSVEAEEVVFIRDSNELPDSVLAAVIRINLSRLCDSDGCYIPPIWDWDRCFVTVDHGKSYSTVDLWIDKDLMSSEDLERIQTFCRLHKTELEENFDHWRLSKSWKREAEKAALITRKLLTVSRFPIRPMSGSIVKGLSGHWYATISDEIEGRDVKVEFIRIPVTDD
ncbi:MAG: hypothetical protein D6698_16655 [Gammaproteobacteria bacterium]|nr:MAG: hypothetical protein D6698_16655 [Gammaproteobacteria bacterium]